MERVRGESTAPDGGLFWRAELAPLGLRRSRKMSLIRKEVARRCRRFADWPVDVFTHLRARVGAADDVLQADHPNVVYRSRYTPMPAK